MATELLTYHVLEDPTSPVPVEGYVVAFMEFYGWEFIVPSHRFLYSLLQYYSLELHHLIPSVILHIAAFVTLCEAYMGLTPLRPVEIVLLHPAPAGLRHRSGGFGRGGYPRQVRACC
jgi:hypothetical protein